MDVNPDRRGFLKAAGAAAGVTLSMQNQAAALHSHQRACQVLESVEGQ